MRYKILKISMSLAALFLSAQRNLFADALTLEDALNQALSDSPAMAASAASIDSALASKVKATGSMLPNLTLSEGFSRTDDPVGVFGGKLRQGKFAASDFGIDALNHPRSINDFHTRAELNMPIFRSGSDWAARGAAEHGVRASEHMDWFERYRLIFAVKRLYYTLVALDRQRGVLDDGIEKLRSVVGSYQLMEAPTSASTTSFYVAKSVRAALESQRVAIDSERAKAICDLNVLMGRDPGAQFRPADTLPPLVAANVGETPRRKDVEAMKSQADAAAQMKRAALRSWGPTVDLFSAYNIHTGDFENAESSYEIGARLSLPLFDGVRRGEIMKAKAEEIRMDNLYRAAELSAYADRMNAQSKLVSSIQQYRILSDGVKSAEMALGEAVTRYKEGSLPLMDYSQAIQNLVQMKMGLVKNHLEAAVATAEVEFQNQSSVAEQGVER